MLSELREPSGPLALLSIVEFLKVLFSCPDLLFFQRNLAAIPMTLTPKGGESDVSSGGPSDVTEDADLCGGWALARVFSKLSPPPSLLPA